MRKVRVLVAAVVATSSACAAVAGLEDLRFDGSEIGAEGGPPRDVSLPDGTKVAPDGRVIQFCDEVDAAYCQDFDTLADAASLGAIVDGGGTAPSLDTSDWVSPTRSLNVQFDIARSGISRIELPISTDRPIRFSFDWKSRNYAETSGQDSDSVIVRRKNNIVALQRTCRAALACDWHVRVETGGDAGGQVNSLNVTTVPPATFEWTRTVFEVNFAQAGGYVKLRFGNDTIVDQSVPTAAEALSTTDLTVPSIGLTVMQGQPGAANMSFDNLVVELL